MLAIWGKKRAYLFVQNYRLSYCVSFEFCRLFWLHPLHTLIGWYAVMVSSLIIFFFDNFFRPDVNFRGFHMWSQGLKVLSLAIQPSLSDICLSITQIPSLHCPKASPWRTVPTLHRQKNDSKSDLTTHLGTVIVHSRQNAEFKVVGNSYLEKNDGVKQNWAVCWAARRNFAMSSN